MFSMPAGSEWFIVLLIVLIFFGVGKLPDVFKQLGKGVKAFKDASTGDGEEGEKPEQKKRKQLAAGDELDEEEKVASSERIRRES